MSRDAVAMLSCHDGWGDGGRNEIDKVLVRSNDGCRIVVISVRSVAGVFVRTGTVELIGVGGEGSQSDGHAGSLEVCGIQGNNADNIVVVGLEVFDGDRGLLWRDIANCLV